jgi:hypothetical protein
MVGSPKWDQHRRSPDLALTYIRYCNGTLGLAMALAMIRSAQPDRMEYKVR